MKPIAYIRSDFRTKFGIPRQSGLVPSLKGSVIFDKQFSNPEAFRELEGFSHIWIIWEFSEAKREDWSPTVRPPRLGGNRRVGVFASRSPFRPNNIGLSCVKLEAIRFENGCAVLEVSGLDILDNTPVFDVKPYIPAADCKQDATEGYTAETKTHRLNVEFPNGILWLLPEDKRAAAFGILAEDPRPSYIDDPERIYGVEFAGYDIRFKVSEDTLTVTEVIKEDV